MKRNLVSAVAGLILATAFVAAQTPTQAPPASPAQQDKEVTLTGCLIQGSTPSTFILDNARVDARDRNEKAKRYVVVAGAKEFDPRPHLNHEVSVVGKAEQKAVPEKPTEKDLPKLTATAIRMVADTCSPAGM